MYDKNLMKMRRGKVSALMMAVMLAATACGNGGATPVTQPLEGSSGSDQVSTPEPTPEITAAPTPEATASPTPKPTPTPEPTPSPTPPPITTNGELSSIGTYAPAETFSDRALVAVKAEEGIFVSWRCYEADSKDITFTLERNGAAVYTGNRTSFLDTAGKSGDT